MDVLVVLAVVLTLHVVVGYFGKLSHISIGSEFLTFSEHLVPDLGFSNVRSLYGGLFDANAALTVIILLVLEWVLSLLRNRW